MDIEPLFLECVKVKGKKKHFEEQNDLTEDDALWAIEESLRVNYFLI
jgi:hypothetical protein